ncbi:MAG: PLP-dependent transferase, partial [Fimbriimonas sp.]
AWLLTRGLRTLELRLNRHESTANTIAEWLEQRPEVEQVNHVSLSSFPQHDLYAKYLRGSGGLFSFVPKTQEPAKLKAFCDRLKIFGRGVSWGGFESLALPLATTALGTPENHWVIRLYCGLEEPVDLILDIEQALVELE